MTQHSPLRETTVEHKTPSIASGGKRNARSSILVPMFLAGVLLGCDSEIAPEAQTGLELFRQCMTKAMGLEHVDAALEESCLQKNEIISENHSGMNVTAILYPKAQGAFLGTSQLKVSYTNPYSFVVTNIEVKFLTPQLPDDPSCFYDESNCSYYFSSGRAWILPKQTGDVLINLPSYLYVNNKDGDRLWGFSFQSIRYLSLN